MTTLENLLAHVSDAAIASARGGYQTGWRRPPRGEKCRVKVRATPDGVRHLVRNYGEPRKRGVRWDKTWRDQ